MILVSPHQIIVPQIFKGFDKSFLRSVKEFGVVNPIQVRLFNGSLILVDGWQRLEATKRLSLTAIPAQVRPGCLEKMLTKEQSPDVLWRALIDLSLHQISQHLGVPIQNLRAYLRRKE